MNRQPLLNIESTEFPAIRRVMGPERLYLDDNEIADLVEKRFEGASADDVENFMRTLQGFAKQAAPIAQRALPGAIQGAAMGSVAGPYGMLAGALLGGAAGALTPPPQPAQPAQPAQQPPAAQPVVAPAPASPVAAPTPQAAAAPQMVYSAPTPAVTQVPQAAPTMAGAQGGQQALAQLITVLSRPETMQALLGLLMNRNVVNLSGRQVPATAFANAIADLAQTVATSKDLNTNDQNTEDYWFDDEGVDRCDIANSFARTHCFLGDLADHIAQQEKKHRSSKYR